jgi:uncharacterized protein (UPF0332 family)
MEKLSIEEKIAISNFRFEKAKETLKDSIIAFKNSSFKMSSNRSYYAVLHAIRSLLILKGLDPVTHDGAKTMFSLYFIKTKLLPSETLKFFNHLLLLRRDVDYGDFEEIEAEDAKNALDMAKRFIKMVNSVRLKLISEIKD